MASYSRTPKKLPMFTTKKTCFVKIIVNDIMVNQMISIPEKFERKHRRSLSRSVLLKVPSGDVWEVALSKMNGQLFLKDGWKKFSDHYSIEYGHFIVFQYEGNSQFCVFIINKSATEINYPYNNQEENFGLGSNSAAEEETEDDDSSLHFIDEVYSDSEDTLDSSFDSQPRKSERTKGKAKKLGGSSKGARRKGAGKKRHQDGFLIDQPLTVDGDAGAGVSNPSFTVQMLETHIPPRSTLSIPSWFGKTYMKEEEGDVILTVLDEGSWPAKYRLCQTSKGSRIRLKEGWGAFAKMNKLAIGDICSFHLLIKDKLEFQVTIYRPDHN